MLTGAAKFPENFTPAEAAVLEPGRDLRGGVVAGVKFSGQRVRIAAGSAGK
jgi:hypothetical protein